MSKYDKVRVCMNITQVSNSYNFRANNNQSFKGLWGRSSFCNDEDSGMGVFINKETRYYHPFSDESKDEIKTTIDKYSDAYIDTENRCYVIKECKVCVPLNISKRDYERYKSAHEATTLNDNIKKAHYELLDKYTNCELNHQTSAVNEVVGSRLSAEG